MKKLTKLCLGTLTMLALVLQAQAQGIMPNLNTELGRYAGGYLRINVTLKEQLNSRALYQKFELEQVPVKRRASIVEAELQAIANRTQPSVLEFIQRFEAIEPGQSMNITPYYIANTIGLEAKPALIKALVSHELVDYIDMSIENYLAPTLASCGVTSEESEAVASSPNGSEQGLKVIKAPFMWNLGYTGRNTFVMIVDDGTLAGNPALRDNFKGNFYPLSESYFSSNGLGLAPTCFGGPETHGTHTAGTVCGLARATNDTIGVAFNALWMGSSPIGTGCPGAADVLATYQKALNPDNNASTDDQPTAINNSWGYTSSGTSFCSNNYTVAVSALEAANVAVVFSAGNDGPAASSVHGLGYMKEGGLVDAFSVGNLDGNSANYTINSSSSRGPNPCGGTGALLIKPEVSAPGTDIRSATGIGGYALLTGTSMSGPHVTGALALLAEAFPNVSSINLKLALYNSATDLGAAGEDNAYGKGLINLQAAYNALIAAGNTPTPAPNPAYDIVVREITNPKLVACTSTTAPVVEFVNLGTTTLSSATITYKLDAGTIQTFNWTGTAAPNQTVRATLPAVTTTQTTNPHTLTVTVSPASGSDANLLNNKRTISYNIKPAVQINTVEAFEFSAMRLTKYTENDVTQDGITWKLIAASGLTGVRSAGLEFFAMSRLNQTDELISSPINVPSTGNIYMYFDRAYKQRSSVFRDSLKIMVSQDCGLTYQQVYAKGGTTLVTTAGNASTSWVPSLAAEWKKDSVVLSQFAGTSDILVKFVGKNGGGNNLYIDNVDVRNTLPPSAENTILGDDKLRIYPNPTNEILWIDYENDNNPSAQITLLNTMGATIQTIQINQRGSGKQSLNLNGLAQGRYILRFCNASGCKNVKIRKD